MTPINRLALAAAAFCLPLALFAATPQETFPTPEKAVDALVTAAEQFDVPALTKILGPDGVDLVVTADLVHDKQQSAAFAAKAREKSRVVRDAKNPHRATLLTGNEDWPMPVPIVEKGGRWQFDSKSGRQEVLYRRIGDNELIAIDICRGYVEAQDEYASERHDGAKLNQYAQRMISTAGKQDGLAWKNPDGTWDGPIGDEVAQVIDEGYTSRHQPYHGYYFKVLKSQGPSAPMGSMDFVVNGAMIGGYALVASPSDYRVTGVKTFIVSHDGIVYEKDLGPDTEKAFEAMKSYDPDRTWSAVRGN